MFIRMRIEHRPGEYWETISGFRQNNYSEFQKTCINSNPNDLVEFSATTEQ